jgi:hypothetical protein
MSKRRRLHHVNARKILENASSTNWEDKLEVKLAFKDSLTGRLRCRVVWKDADVSTHPVEWLHVKCPRNVCHLSLIENPS